LHPIVTPLGVTLHHPLWVYATVTSGVASVGCVPTVKSQSGVD